eukprot:TRINITY_DN6477_c0_g1_i2.p1 TRINITY_DN6477_c0_g1~~TRINITY_DN6477_c0_g1_i2.p1  ORF type:complete len:167 (-),score=4.50 TRINITY_DN6477_c0_g1_i2:14-514(-)
MLKDHQITRLIEDYHVSFPVDLKGASLCVGIISSHYPCIWCTWGWRNGLSKVEYNSRSSTHHKKMFQKFCDEYNGNIKDHSINCDGIEDPGAFNIWLTDYMQIFNLPDLSQLLGIGQKLYDAITAAMSKDEKVVHEDLFKKHNIQRSNIHGGAFEGNAMRKSHKKR